MCWRFENFHAYWPIGSNQIKAGFSLNNMPIQAENTPLA